MFGDNIRAEDKIVSVDDVNNSIYELLNGLKDSKEKITKEYLEFKDSLVT